MFIVPSNARSWVPYDATSHFPIQNLPFALLAPAGRNVTLATAIGDYAVDLTALRDAGILDVPRNVHLDAFAEFTNQELSDLRHRLYEIFEESNPRLRDNEILRMGAMTPISEARLLLPVNPPAYVDFYSGIHHASNVGKMFRPDMPPLLPNYRHVPVGYNGRASSVVVSGTPIRRPKGQTKGANDELPTFGPTKELDFELEMGFFVGRPSAMGEPVPISEVADYILGYVLVNDWSARDVQRWEYVPLGPFLAKSFATSVSPWVVLPDALEPFRLNDLEQDPEPLPYLATKRPLRYDIKLEVYLQPSGDANGQNISTSNAKYLYWSFDQQLAHQASNGTPLGWGDLYASGTISGPLEGSFGSMLELTWRGTKPLPVGSVQRTFLEDGDTLVLTGYCQGDGFRVGFGSVSGTIEPA
ncbi:MAG: fumarylacetoacetase [Armatimonadetes bacterium]|nr:fumarylacetoacetase [Armatimonadota bacterium]